MQLLEVKNNIAKISYNPSENRLLPSDFLMIEDINQKLVGQILSVYTTEKSTNNNIADVRLVLYIDKEDKISYYNGYIPPRSAKVIYITTDEITEMINNSSANIYMGNLTYHPKNLVKVPLSLVNDRLYIQCDREDNTKIIVQNIVSSLYMQQKKVVLLDFDGRYNRISNVPRLTVTESFNFPLNIDAFNNILEYDTQDCPIEDKAVIQSIVLELRDYVKTLENKFLPFTLFKNVVISEFAANPISGLMLLRNKLWEYAQEGLFAESKSDFDIINNVLRNENIVIVDASKIDEKWYKFAIQTIPNIINANCYFAFSLNDVKMDKRSIVSLYNNSKIIPIVSTSFDSQFRGILKSLSKNQILFKPIKQTEVDEQYGVLIHKLNDDNFILYGEASLNLPLIIDLKPFDVQTTEKLVEQEIRRNVDKILSSGKSMLPKEAVINSQGKRQKSSSYTVDEDFNDDDLDFLDSMPDKTLQNEPLNQNNIEEQNDGYKLFDPFAEFNYTKDDDKKDVNFSELVGSTVNQIVTKPINDSAIEKGEAVEQSFDTELETEQIFDIEEISKEIEKLQEQENNIENVTENTSVITDEVEEQQETQEIQENEENEENEDDIISEDLEFENDDEIVEETTEEYTYNEEEENTIEQNESIEQQETQDFENELDKKEEFSNEIVQNFSENKEESQSYDNEFDENLREDEKKLEDILVDEEDDLSSVLDEEDDENKADDSSKDEIINSLFEIEKSDNGEVVDEQPCGAVDAVQGFDTRLEETNDNKNSDSNLSILFDDIEYSNQIKEEEEETDNNILEQLEPIKEDIQQEYIEETQEQGIPVENIIAPINEDLEEGYVEEKIIEEKPTKSILAPRYENFEENIEEEKIVEEKPTKNILAPRYEKFEEKLNDENAKVPYEPINSADENISIPVARHNANNEKFVEPQSPDEEKEVQIEEELSFTTLTEPIKIEDNETAEKPDIERKEFFESIEDKSIQSFFGEELSENDNTKEEIEVKQERKRVEKKKINDEEIVPISNIIENIKQQAKNPMNAVAKEEIKEEVKQEQAKHEQQKKEQVSQEQSKSAPKPERIPPNRVQTKKLTVYETDTPYNLAQSGEIELKVGDRVYHPKHGKGVVEGFAQYSNKILFCRIEFENAGRRILDPRISGLEKI